jgi:hypothetical protein
MALAAAACTSDTSTLEKDVASIKSDLKTRQSTKDSELQSIKDSIGVLQVANLRSRGFDPNDPNHAKDAPGRGDEFTVQRVSKGAVVMDVTVRRQPADKSLYLWLQLVQEGQPPKWVRAGEIKTDKDGLGTLKVNIPTAPGTYQIGGIGSNVDKETGPYAGRVYICVPVTKVLVTA